MFKIEETDLLCNRGDECPFKYGMAITDEKGYISYKDENENQYWYDAKNNVLYDADYKKSSVDIKTLTIELAKFQVGDKLKFNIYEKNGYNKKPLLSKTFTVNAETDIVNIYLSASDTTIGEISNKKQTYWYDISLNEDKTTLGYDTDGPKLFIIYPAKGDGE